MPLIIDGGRIPSRWAERKILSSVTSMYSGMRRSKCISLALINNMPDPALEDTELQFFDLLDIASGDIPVFVKLYSLTGVPRTDRGERHLNSFYFPFDDLWQSRFDGVIITGTEPRFPDLRQEPYWNLLTQVFDWAHRNTNSTILSCLAAHAAVLHCDGINRYPLPDKRFGVFESVRNSDHALVGQGGSVVRFPHSRWNEVRERELTDAGYQVLTKSAQAGADLFVKKKKKSLFVHFQGHPEYGAQSLGKEYRRDIKRYLRGERETYPNLPFAYFDDKSIRDFDELKAMALADRREEIIDNFPDHIVEELKSTWLSSATLIYRNWLGYLGSVAEQTAFLPMSAAHSGSPRKQSAIS